MLDGIDLHVDPGQTVALVGETGAGKTTIVKLLTRFHDPTAGRVRVDSVDLRTVTQGSLRKQMGMVLQDPFLFNGTVKENILFGRLDARDDEVIAAAQAAADPGADADWAWAFRPAEHRRGLGLRPAALVWLGGAGAGGRRLPAQAH